MPSKSQPSKKAIKKRHSGTIKSIREKLAKTQAELGTALGISEKAIQSYEQGWRDTPTKVMIQLLMLLAIQRKRALDNVPCWEIKDCPNETKEQCPAFTMSDGQFCWFVAAKFCQSKEEKKSSELLPCMSCPVIKRLLKS